jgi:hypothetical protein
MSSDPVRIKKVVSIMRKQKPIKITREQLIKLKATAVRQARKEQGMFDGRFRTRTEDTAKNYSRKLKHKNNFKDTEV